jgi:nicotinamide mononucleotide transporter
LIPLSPLQQFVEGLRASSLAETVSVLAGLAYGVLAVRQNRLCWVFGGVSSAILAWLAARSRLPMQSLLQVAYVVMSVYGFLRWSRQTDGAASLTIRWWPWRVHVGIGFVIALLTWSLAPWIAATTQAAWPRLDTATMLASLLATWMVARMRLENWLYWIVIDAIAVFLYGSQGLMFVAVLYFVYLVIAVFGWFEWRARLRLQSAPVT